MPACVGNDENWGFISGHVKFEIPVRFPAGNVKLAIEYVKLESRGEVSAGNIHLGDTTR